MILMVVCPAGTLAILLYILFFVRYTLYDIWQNTACNKRPTGPTDLPRSDPAARTFFLRAPRLARLASTIVTTTSTISTAISASITTVTIIIIIIHAIPIITIRAHRLPDGVGAHGVFTEGPQIPYMLLAVRPVHLLRVSLLRVLESNFPGDPL